jgi:hypothetical protein
MRPDEPKIGLPLPDAACDVTREHLRAIANATRNFAADAIYKDRDPLGAAIARDGAAPALRAAMYDGKVDAYTKPVAALATVIQEAGQGRLSADQAKAIGRATAAHMLNTLLRGVDECAAFVAPEMGVRAVQPRNLDTRSVVHSLHSSATYTAAPRPPAVSDSQSQGRGGQSQ